MENTRKRLKWVLLLPQLPQNKALLKQTALMVLNLLPHPRQPLHSLLRHTVQPGLKINKTLSTIHTVVS